MLTLNNILAGEILMLLESARRSLSIAELRYLLNEPAHRIRAAVERLARDGLAVVDNDGALVKHAALDLNSRRRRSGHQAFGEALAAAC